LLVVALVVFLVPLGWTVLASFGVVPRGTAPPSLDWSPTLDHYAEVGVAEPQFWQELATSTMVAIASTIVSVLVGLLAAYALARSRFAARRVVVQSFLILASLPVVAYAIPLGEVMRRLGWPIRTQLVIGVAAVTAPLAVYVLFGQLSGFSTEGGGRLARQGRSGRVLWNVVLPLVGPAVAATAIILFVLDWNLLLVPLVVASVDVKTIPVAMSDFFTFERELEWPTAAAALVISLIPLTILVAVGHRLLDRFTLRAGRHHESDPRTAA
jgi:ABC-type glycerol-3-phosphate transport system permease component